MTVSNLFAIHILNIILAFISELSILDLTCLATGLEENSLNQQLSVKGRKELEAKMGTVFSEKIKGLSVELQKILLDDMVTAFENRLIVFKHAQGKLSVKAEEKAEAMRRSKLEMYVDILKVLAQRGPLKLTHVMYKANVNCRC